ncbi:MAG: phosphatase PAP2 family protein [Idiomarina loihiensis]
MKITSPRNQWLLLTLIFISTFVLAESLHLKFLVADQIYRLEGSQWSLRHHFLTKTVSHEGVRWLNLVAVISLLSLTLLQFLKPKKRTKRLKFLLLLLSVLFSFGLVNYLKATLGMDCPWDLRIYGGTKPYSSFWSSNASGVSPGRCFPSGHSSIGFAWIALYFFWKESRPRLAKAALIFSLFVGFILGGVQQLRGAHFFVDDFATAFICWSVALLTFHIGEQHETNNN